MQWFSDSSRPSKHTVRLVQDLLQGSSVRYLKLYIHTNDKTKFEYLTVVNPIRLRTTTFTEPQCRSSLDNSFLHYFPKEKKKKREDKATPMNSYCQKGQKKEKKKKHCYGATREHLTSVPPSPSSNKSIMGSQSYKGHPKWIFFEIHSTKLKKKEKEKKN